MFNKAMLVETVLETQLYYQFWVCLEGYDEIGKT